MQMSTMVFTIIFITEILSIIASLSVLYKNPEHGVLSTRILVPPVLNGVSLPGYAFSSKTLNWLPAMIHNVVNIVILVMMMAMKTPSYLMSIMVFISVMLIADMVIQFSLRHSSKTTMKTVISIIISAMIFIANFMAILTIR